MRLAKLGDTPSWICRGAVTQAAGAGARGRPSPTSMPARATSRSPTLVDGHERQGSNRVMPERRSDRRRVMALPAPARRGLGAPGAGLGARPAGDDRRPVLSLDRLPRARARLGRRPDDRARPRARRPAAGAGARRAPRPARRRSRRPRPRRSTAPRSRSGSAMRSAAIAIRAAPAIASTPASRDSAHAQRCSRRLPLPHDPAGAVSGPHAAHPRQAAPPGVRRGHLAALRRRRPGNAGDFLYRSLGRGRAPGGRDASAASAGRRRR